MRRSRIKNANRKKNRSPRSTPDDPEMRRRLRQHKALDVKKMIEKSFAKRIKVTERGKTETTTVFSAIVTQLSNRVSRGEKRAPRILLKYQDYAFRHGNSQAFIIVRQPSEGER